MKKRENLAKALYDLGKLVFAAFGIGYFINTKIKFIIFILGMLFTIVMFVIGYIVDAPDNK